MAASGDVGGGRGAIEVEEPGKELGCDCFLSPWWRVGGFKGPEELTEGGTKVGAVRDVKGAVPKMVPKRQSHLACGTPDSTVNHGFRTFAKKASCWRPGCVAVDLDESAADKLASWFLESVEEGIGGEPCPRAEGEPLTPGSVLGLVSAFGLRRQDDSARRNARVAKDEISAGRGEIAKL